MPRRDYYEDDDEEEVDEERERYRRGGSGGGGLPSPPPRVHQDVYKASSSTSLSSSSSSSSSYHHHRPTRGGEGERGASSASYYDHDQGNDYNDDRRQLPPYNRHQRSSSYSASYGPSSSSSSSSAGGGYSSAAAGQGAGPGAATGATEEQQPTRYSWSKFDQERRERQTRPPLLPSSAGGPEYSANGHGSHGSSVAGSESGGYYGYRSSPHHTHHSGPLLSTPPLPPPPPGAAAHHSQYPHPHPHYHHDLDSFDSHPHKNGYSSTASSYYSGPPAYPHSAPHSAPLPHTPPSHYGGRSGRSNRDFIALARRDDVYNERYISRGDDDDQGRRFAPSFEHTGESPHGRAPEGLDRGIKRSRSASPPPPPSSSSSSSASTDKAGGGGGGGDAKRSRADLDRVDDFIPALPQSSSASGLLPPPTVAAMPMDVSLSVLPPILSQDQYLTTLQTIDSGSDPVTLYQGYRNAMIFGYAKNFFDKHSDEEWLKELYDSVYRKDAEAGERQEARFKAQRLLASEAFKTVRLDQASVASLVAFLEQNESAWDDEAVAKMQEKYQLPKGTLDESDSHRSGGSIDSSDYKSRRKDSHDSEPPLPVSIDGSGVRHRSNMLFLISVAPNIAKRDLEKLFAERAPFLRVWFTEPNTTKRFHRLGWAAFHTKADIQKACNAVNNTVVNGFTLRTMVNKFIPLRTRYQPEEYVLSAAEAREVAPLALDLVRSLDKRKSVEGESELLKFDPSSEDEAHVFETLDRLAVYLRLVHRVCVFCMAQYASYEQMLQKCGVAHVRETCSNADDATKDSRVMLYGEFVHSKPLYLQNLRGFLARSARKEQLTDEEIQALGAQSEDTVAKEFVDASVVKVNEEKFRCSICSTPFKGAEFVTKHIQSKHQDEIDAAIRKVVMFNNYLRDPERIMTGAVFSLPATNAPATLPNIAASSSPGLLPAVPALIPTPPTMLAKQQQQQQQQSERGSGGRRIISYDDL